MIARIYTEDKNRQKIYDIIEAAGFDGFTVFEATGFWKGKEEKSLVIEIMDNAAKFGVIEWIAGRINYINKQQACLVTFFSSGAEFDFITKKVKRGGEIE